MKMFIDKASVLIEALPYIQKFKGKKVVIKYGGSVISEEVYCRSILRDVVFMKTVGMHPIIVHGGGKIISDRLRNAGIEPKFVHGLRYTCKETMDIVSTVLRKEVSKHIADILNEFGAEPFIVNGIDHKAILCSKKKEHLGKSIELGFVGNVDQIDKELILKACDDNKIPIIAPVGVDASGQAYNINADIMAGELCYAIQAEKMVYLSDISGILKDVDDPSSIISSVRESSVDPMIKDGTIHGGMIPKILACLRSLASGSQKVHIIDGRLQHSLLLEIFTDKGVGTEIIPD